MKNILLLLLFSWTVFGRVVVENTGTVRIDTLSSSAPVRVNDLVINGVSTKSHISYLQDVSDWADLLNVNWLSTLRHQLFTISTPGRGSAIRTSDGNLFLAVGNGVSTPNGQTIWRWNNSTSSFDSPQTFTSNVNQGNLFFTVGTNTFLIDSPNTNSPNAYFYGTGTFSLARPLGSASSIEWEYFRWNNADWLAQATQSGVVNSVFRLQASGNNFTSTNTFITDQTQIREWQFCPVSENAPHLLAARDVDNSVTAYTFNGAQWATVVTSFSASTPLDVECFSDNGFFYLVVAETNTTIRKWNGTQYIFVRNLPSVVNAISLRIFSLGGRTHLLSTTNGGRTFLHRWNTFTESFNPVSSIGDNDNSVLNGRAVFTFVAPDNRTYAFISTTTTSYLYRLSI